MKKRTAVIGALVSLLPMGLSLVVRTGAVLTSASVMLAAPVKAEVESAESYLELGLNYLLSEDYYESISAFNKAIEIEPKRGYLYYKRARAKYLLDDYEGSLRDYKRAKNLDSNLASASYLSIAYIKDALGDYDAAIFAFNKSIELGTNNLYAYYYRGKTKEKKVI